ncbi:MAG TPA: cytochrome c oxidase accessory protein CcoG [Verrucomicrobiales bacterium]|nr:cytochrome c oxidase accessory protein CcoG [Verrucomicrobiales bacterium]
MSTLSTEPIDHHDPEGKGNVQEVRWEDFRDHLATADKDGNRRWLHPRKPVGRFYRARTYVSYLLLAILFAGPFIRINGNPLLLFNIIDRKFSILGQIFWPQDGIIFAVGMLLFFTGILVFTSAFGRLWCGWTCPQTLLMEMVFRKIEYWIDGDAHEQRLLAAAPLTLRKAVKRVGKQLLFFILSFIIANTLLSYIIGSEQLYLLVTDPPSRHLSGLTAMILFTAVFYLIFARFREQACTFICPYGRFQSVLLDENTVVVAYDYKRGEKRARMQGGVAPAARGAAGLGHCVDCGQCVAVCPTGIDIRNGTQMECVNCTACIDACDAVMDKVKLPRGLVRYASLNGIERGESIRLTPRMIGYLGILGILGILLTGLLFTRTDIETTVLRAPGALFQSLGEGRFSNLYTMKMVNKTSRVIPLQLKLEGSEGRISVLGRDPVVQPQKLSEDSVLIEMPARALKGPTTPLVIGVYSDGRLISRVKTVFVGPRDGSQDGTSK